MSIDLFGDFNEELDAQAGDYDEEDENRGVSPDPDGNDPEDPDNPDADKEKVEAKVKVARTKRKIPTLNAERLKGNRGIVAIEDFYQNMKFKGKGYEKQDLDEVMKRLEHWAHRMFPKFNFDDSLATIERLGKKKEVNVHMVRYRMGQLTKDDDQIVLDDQENDGEMLNYPQDEPMDEFEALIDEQIALTTAQSRSNINASNRSFGNISGISGIASQHNTTAPSQKSHSSPSQPKQPQLSDEVRARIAANRLKALAILEQKKKEAGENQNNEKPEEKSTHISNVYIDDDDF